MNKNILIIIAGGFLVAVLVAVLLQSMLGGSNKEEETQAIQILVAAKDLSVGKELKEGDLRWQNWPEDTIFSGAIIRDGEQPAVEALEGKLLRSLAEDQPVSLSLVVEDDKGNFLSANVAKGMRAVGVSVKAYTLADRLVRPGDYVDVMMTYKVNVNTRRNPEAASLVNRYATETVLENIKILAIDSNDTKAVDEEEENGKPKKKKKSSKNATVTLEVTPEGSEKLVLADRLGDIGFALRAIGDDKTSKTSPSTTDVEMSDVMTKLTKMTGASSAVRIYNGDNMVEVRGRRLDDKENKVDFSVEQEAAPEQNIVITPEALRQLGNEE